MVRRPLRSLLACAAVLIGAAPVSVACAQQAEARASLLVTPAWLSDHLRDPKLVLLHVGTPEEFAKTHIPGAHHVTLDDISTPHDPTPGALMLEMPSADSLRARLARMGISDDSRIIVYFGNNWVSPSTRLMLTLQYVGLGKSASLLDGGMPAWVAAGHATTADVTTPTPGKLSALKTTPVIVTGDWVHDNATKPGYALIDARSAAFYDGVSEGGPASHRVKGHIPGAKNVPFDTVWTANNQLRSPAELKEIFAKAGVKPGDTVVGYCHIGQQATAMLFAAQSLGIKAVLYDGSMEDWAYHGWPVELSPKR